MYLPALCFCLLASIVHSTFDGDSFRGKLEDPIDQKPCTRLFTNTFDIGCRTPSHSESLGALYEIRSMDDIDEISKIKDDIAIVASTHWFNDTLRSLPEHSSNIVGIIFYTEDMSSPVSTDVTSPQGEGTPQASYTSYADYAWNNKGTGHMYTSFG